MFLTAFLSFFHLSNMVPHAIHQFDFSRHFTGADVFFQSKCVQLLLKWSKTIQSRDEVKLITFPKLGSSVICHYRVLKNLFILYAQDARASGTVFMKGLSQGFGLKLTLLSQVSPQKTFVLGLVVFTKNLRLVVALAKGSTSILVGSGLKEDLNMAAINFFPLQNLKWL